MLLKVRLGVVKKSQACIKKQLRLCIRVNVYSHLEKKRDGSYRSRSAYSTCILSNLSPLLSLTLQVTAVVMHLGELKFKQKSSKDEQAVADEEQAAKRVARLLGMNAIFFLSG